MPDHGVSSQDTAGTESQPKWAVEIGNAVDGWSPKPMCSGAGNRADGSSLSLLSFSSSPLGWGCVPCATLGWKHTSPFVTSQGLESQETWISASKGSGPW